MQEAHKHKDRFCASQQPALEALWHFVGQQRQKRRMVCAPRILPAHV